MHAGKSKCQISSDVIFIHTGVSPFVTGGAYSGSPGSAKWLTNCPMPTMKRQCTDMTMGYSYRYSLITFLSFNYKNSIQREKTDYLHFKW
jgi:hypothetical protein